MSRCLVTGASGFVGSNLTAALRQQGRDVRCLVRPSSDVRRLTPLDVEIVQAQLDDADALRRALHSVDVIFHVAGLTTALDASHFTRVNVDLSRRLAELCAQCDQPPTLVFVSSLAAGGPGTAESPRRETDQESPVSAYGRSKLAAERELARVSDRVPVSIVRPPIIFGPADRASLSLYRTIRISRLHPLPGFRQFSVSLIHVADLCDGLSRVADRGNRVAPEDRQRGTYYVAADRSVSYPEFGRLAGRAAGWTTVPLPLPKTVFWIVGGMGELFGRVRQQATILNFDKIREAMAPGWVCSDEKIRAELDYRPAAPLEQRFAETVAWYRNQGWL